MRFTSLVIELIRARPRLVVWIVVLLQAAMWLFVALVCVVGLSSMYWHHVRPPACPHCGVRLFEDTSTVVTDTPPVIETVYRCPRCAWARAQRSVGAWD